MLRRRSPIFNTEVRLLTVFVFLLLQIQKDSNTLHMMMVDGHKDNLRGLKGILERSGWLERCGGLECFGWPTLSILLCRQVQISVPIFKLV